MEPTAGNPPSTSPQSSEKQPEATADVDALVTELLESIEAGARQVEQRAVLTDSARELYERRYIQSMRNALIGHPEGPTAQQRLALTNVTTGQGRIAATIAAFRNAMTASSVPVDGLSLAKGGYVMEVECDEKAQRRMAYAAPKPGETP